MYVYTCGFKSPKSSKYGIFGITLFRSGESLERFLFTKFGVGRSGVPGPYSHAKFHCCWFRNMDLLSTKSSKSAITCHTERIAKYGRVFFSLSDCRYLGDGGSGTDRREILHDGTCVPGVFSPLPGAVAPTGESRLFSPSGKPIILVFPHQTGRQ